MNKWDKQKLGFTFFSLVLAAAAMGVICVILNAPKSFIGVSVCLCGVFFAGMIAMMIWDVWTTP